MFNDAELVGQVQIDIGQVKQALQHDGEFFIQFFIAEELVYDVPTFHVDVFGLMTHLDVPQCAFAIPRDHAKTTLAKLAVVHYFLFSSFRFIVYVSSTAAIAVRAVNDIISYMQSENFVAVYGVIKFEIEQQGAGLYKFTLGGKVCMLRALGAGQQVRGINIDNQRPEVAVVDDLEDNDNIATDDLFMKLKRWFYGPFKKCLDKRKHKIIHIGNMISNKCLLKEHCESEFWYSRRYGCLLSNGEPLWKDAWSLEKLREDFTEYLSVGMIDVWFAEMMNLPLASGLGLIKSDDIFYQPSRVPEEIEFGFITIDPAISEKDWAHKCCVAVHGWVGTHWQIVEVEYGVGIDPIELFKIVLKLCFKWQISVVGIESVAYQASIKFVFQYLCAEHNIIGLEFVDLEAKARKTERLSAWCALIREKQYAINEGDLIITEQLLLYDPKSKNNDDDIIDSCAYAPQMIERYMNLITATFKLTPPAKVKTSYDVSAV